MRLLLLSSLFMSVAALVSQDWTKVQEGARSTLRTSRVPKELYYAAVVLHETLPPEAQGLGAHSYCSNVQDMIRSAKKLSDLSYSLRAAKLVQCSASGFSLPLITDGLDSKKVTDLYHALGAAAALPSTDRPSIDADRIIKVLASLKEGNLFRMHKRARPTALATALALHSFSDIADLVPAKKSAVSPHLSAALKSANSLITDVVEGNDAFSLSTSDPVLTASLLLTALDRSVRHSKKSDFKAEPENLRRVAELLAVAARAGDVIGTGQSVTALHTISRRSTSVLPAPLLLHNRSPVVETGDKGETGDLVLELGDVFGQSPERVEVQVVSVSKDGEAVSSLLGQKLKQRSDGKLHLPFAAQLPSPGLYDLVVTPTVTSADNTAWTTGQISLKVKATTPITIGPASINVAKSRHANPNAGKTIDYPLKEGGVMNVEQGEFVFVSFRVLSSITKEAQTLHQVGGKKEMQDRLIFLLYSLLSFSLVSFFCFFLSFFLSVFILIFLFFA